MVDGARIVTRTRYGGKADTGVHRVVHGRTAIVMPANVDHHQIRSLCLERFVVEPSSRRKVRQKESAVRTRGADQVLDQLLPPRRANVDCDRALPLVEARPEQAAAVAGDRPTVVVEAAANRIEADHICAELGERHSAERSCNECRSLDDAHSTQYGIQLETLFLRVKPACNSEFSIPRIKPSVR